MPSLPPLDIKKNINYAPHVVILGAGASYAAFPNGDKNGKVLPLMRNMVEIIGLEPLLQSYGVTTGYEDFESLYDSLANDDKYKDLTAELENAVHAYFAEMRLPEEATLYDLLLLSLRDKDVIATFNWDPFLADAVKRNRHIMNLPRILFLHGNVDVGVCTEHRSKGFLEHSCSTCGQPFTPTRLLFPVKQKDYTTDSFIENEWNEIQFFLEKAYLVTIFGYSAPATDVEAKELLLNTWKNNNTRELAEIELINISPRKELEENWSEFFVRQHYAIFDKIGHSLSFRHVRRSCEAFAMATLQQVPWKENNFPETKSLEEIHRWLHPLLVEEANEQLTGEPCEQIKP